MPVEINFIDNGSGIEYIALGSISGKDIIEAKEKIFTRDNLLKLKYILIDRTRCIKYNVTTEEIKTIAEHCEMALTINPDIIIALVSITPLQYGMSRMLESYVDGSGMKCQIFKDRQDADNWIKTKLNVNTALS